MTRAFRVLRRIRDYKKVILVQTRELNSLRAEHNRLYNEFSDYKRDIDRRFYWKAEVQTLHMEDIIEARYRISRQTLACMRDPHVIIRDVAQALYHHITGNKR